jgi:hypothetical protein
LVQAVIQLTHLKVGYGCFGSANTVAGTADKLITVASGNSYYDLAQVAFTS